jgi:hypothetical protein
MPRTITDAGGVTWQAAPSGRRTQYGQDELGLAFTRTGAGPAERRFIRFTPQGAKAAELAFEALSDRALLGLLAQAQPAWTSPDGGYARPASP